MEFSEVVVVGLAIQSGEVFAVSVAPVTDVGQQVDQLRCRIGIAVAIEGDCFGERCARVALLLMVASRWLGVRI